MFKATATMKVNYTMFKATVKVN